MNVVRRLRRADWLWMIVAGFYLIAYLFWYVPALVRLPDSLREPPAQFPWHWPLDFAITALSGGVLVVLGFRRVPEQQSAREPAGRDGDR